MESNNSRPDNRENAGPGNGTEDPRAEQQRDRDDLCREIGEAERRKKQARQKQEATVWLGLGTFGLVGWSVAIPVLAGIAVGLWLDANWPASFSWTLTLLFAGIVVGCLNAWYWITRERQQIEQETVIGRRKDNTDDTGD